MFLPENCDPRHPKLGRRSENRCSFVLDDKYDELRWFGLARITAHGVNVFRRVGVEGEKCSNVRNAVRSRRGDGNP
jgi:hypothetical protein